jgi:hypothetical protein
MNYYIIISDNSNIHNIYYYHLFNSYMSQFYKEFDTSKSDVFTNLAHFFDKNTKDLDFKPSNLYNSKTEELLVDVEERSSEYALIETPEIFNLFEAYLNEITKDDVENKYDLLKDNITFIRYNEGDFFSKHHDTININTNIYDILTLIVCIDGTCEGGRTVFHINEYFQHASSASNTRGHSVMFRKDLEHEGEKLKNGHKWIAVANIIRIPKKTENKIVVCSIKSSKPCKDRDAEIYVFPWYKIKSTRNIIKTTIIDEYNLSDDDEKLAESSSDDEITIYKFNVVNWTYQQFNIIYKILMGMHIVKNEYQYNLKMIDEYGISVEHILIDNIDHKEYASKSKPIEWGNKIVLVDTEEQQNYYNNLFKESKLGIIPFKAHFLEIYSTVIDDCGNYESYEINNRMCVFGDYDQIYMYKPKCSDDEVYQFAKFRFDREDEVSGYSAEGPPTNMKQDFTISDKRKVLSKIAKKDINIVYPYMTLGFDGEKLGKQNYTTGFVDLPSDDKFTTDTDYYSLDENNKMFLKEKHRAQLYNYIDNFNVKLTEEVEQKSFTFTQTLGDKSVNLCNETGYRKLNTIIIYGFININDTKLNHTSISFKEESKSEKEEYEEEESEEESNLQKELE